MTFSNPSTFLPPVLATGQGASSNGRQQLGSGLVTHRGLIDSNTFRAQGLIYPQSGRGTEMIYNQAGLYGIVQSYDRDAQAYTDLYLSAKNINLQAQGGKVTLPAGTAQAVIGQWYQASGWSVPAINQWLESDVRVNFTGTGAPIRIEVAAPVSVPPGGQAYLGLGLDGAVTWANMMVALNTGSSQNIMMMTSLVHHTAGSVGAHRIGLWMYCNVLPTNLSAGAMVSLWLTEYRA